MTDSRVDVYANKTDLRTGSLVVSCFRRVIFSDGVPNVAFRKAVSCRKFGQRFFIPSSSVAGMMEILADVEPVLRQRLLSPTGALWRLDHVGRNSLHYTVGLSGYEQLHDHSSRIARPPLCERRLDRRCL